MLVTPDLVKTSTETLQQFWTEIQSLADAGPLLDCVDDLALLAHIRQAMNSPTKSYRYVLPTQLLAKCADPAVDCRSVQARSGGPGAFDARTVAHKVIVPFDQSNDRVLGGSGEPYVNNPLRVPRVSTEYRGKQKNSADWDSLCSVLDQVETANEKAFTEMIFRQVLIEVHRRRSQVRVVYPIPGRISWASCKQVLQEFLREHSGGDRLLAVTSALFVVIGTRFRLYSTVRRAAITASDEATGMLADLECVTNDGQIVLVIEVKDRVLTITQMRRKLTDIREKSVSEIFFVAQGVDDDTKVQTLMRQEFASGQNVYVTTLTELAGATLALVGERSRKDFLQEVGLQLDNYGSDVRHRRAWAALLAAV